MTRTPTDKIREYLAINSNPSRHTLRCLMGMLEGGEIEASDLIDVGDYDLLKSVQNWRDVK